ncbi:MAG TPA: hypothetical protein VGY57_08560, partial [Vicinamibacterales bacterium]|nr:hypothetical protein [Vicinamibacterales bacterium]
MRRFIIAAAAVAAFAAPVIASADSLYVAPPVSTAPGHPMRLGPDHRASQIGDLVAVQFNFSVNSSSTDVTTNAKGYNVGLGAGTGNAALSF